jgi:hypothetical protein
MIARALVVELLAVPTHVICRPCAVAMFVALACTQPATASDWTTFRLSNSSSEEYGTAAKVSGVLDDRHKTRAAQLVVACTNGITSVLMNADYLVFGGDVVRVEYTVDGGPLRRAYWNVCAGDLCAGLWDGPGVLLARSFFDASTLKLTLTRHFGEPIYVAFPVQGAREALVEVGRQCHWGQR